MRQGYTLVEVMVSLIIFTILVTATIAAFRGVTINDRIKAAAQQLTSDMREARNQAFNGIADGVNYPTTGYGMYFDISTLPATYSLFTDTDSNNYYEPAKDHTIRTVTLPAEIGLQLSGKANVKKMAIFFNKSNYPLLYNQTSCPPPDGVNFCLGWTINLPVNNPVAVKIQQVGASNGCSVSLKLAPTTASQSLLIDKEITGC